MHFKKALLPLAISVLFVPSFAVAEDAISGEVTYTQPYTEGLRVVGTLKGDSAESPTTEMEISGNFATMEGLALKIEKDGVIKDAKKLTVGGFTQVLGSIQNIEELEINTTRGSEWAQIGLAVSGSLTVDKLGVTGGARFSQGQVTSLETNIDELIIYAEDGEAKANLGKLTADSITVYGSEGATLEATSLNAAKLSVTDTGHVEVGSGIELTEELSVNGQASVSAKGAVRAQSVLLQTSGSLTGESLITDSVRLYKDSSLTITKGDSDIDSFIQYAGSASFAGDNQFGTLQVLKGAEFSNTENVLVTGTAYIKSNFEAGSLTAEKLSGVIRVQTSDFDVPVVTLNNSDFYLEPDSNAGVTPEGITLKQVNFNGTDDNRFQTKVANASIEELNVNGELFIQAYGTEASNLKIDKLTTIENSNIRINDTEGFGSAIHITDAEFKSGTTFSNINRDGGLQPVFKTVDFENINAADSTIVNQANGKIDIGTLTGSNNILSVEDTRENQISIGKNTSTDLTLVSSDSSYGNSMSSVDQGVADLAATVNLNTNGGEGAEGMKVVIGANDMTGRVEAVYDAEGNKVSQTEEVNETNRTLTAIANLPVVAWRAELNDLYKRMGDLRNDLYKRMGDLRATPYKSGAWVRYNGGKFKWSDGDLENDFHMIQVGIDTMSTENNIRFGTAFSYTKGDADFDGGSADLDTYSLALYGTWLGDKGQYVDVIGRVASIKNDANARSLTGQGKAYDGKMDNTGLSLSAEAGWRFALPYNLFIEPQVEATYSYIDSDSFRYGDRKYELQSTDSFIARAGFMAGIQCPDNKGNVYVIASVVHDFLGETDVKVSNAHMSRTVSNDFGGTWGEFGIGANVSVSDNTYVYADVEHTTGGEIEEPWRVNFGVRYNF